VTGIDPFFEFSLLRDATNSNFQFLYINISCVDQRPQSKIAFQLFWSVPGKAFSEENSFRFEVNENGHTIDLSSLDKWNKKVPIEKIRLDIDSPHCSEFLLYKFLLGN
jgi:hypothetical protein